MDRQMNSLPSSYRCRPATNEDGSAVRDIVFNALSEHGLRPDPDGVDGDLFDIQSFYHHPAASFDVLVNTAGEIVGTLALLPANEQDIELRKMYLVPHERGKGLGRWLLEHAIEQSLARGYVRMVLDTDTALSSAIRLYEQHGFRPIARCDSSPMCNRSYGLVLSERAVSALGGASFK